MTVNEIYLSRKKDSKQNLQSWPIINLSYQPKLQPTTILFHSDLWLGFQYQKNRTSSPSQLHKYFQFPLSLTAFPPKSKTKVSVGFTVSTMVVRMTKINITIKFDTVVLQLPSLISITLHQKSRNIGARVSSLANNNQLAS